MSKREQSKFINLRKFHNKIKRNLIKNTSKLTKKKNINLLDVSVGRMGDYHSWNASDIKYVYGIDPSKDSILEARKRYKELKKDKKNKTNVDLQVLTITNKEFNFKGNETKYDIVSCQFSIHYFFKNEGMIDRAIERISNFLNPGGYFIGTSIDGYKIDNMFKNKGIRNKSLIKNKIENSEYLIWKKYKENKEFGSKYSFDLKDNQAAGLYQFEADEYLVFIDTLNKICNKHNLNFIEKKDFKQYYTKSDNLKDYEQTVSFLYFTFIFQKQTPVYRTKLLTSLTPKNEKTKGIQSLYLKFTSNLDFNKTDFIGPQPLQILPKDMMNIMKHTVLTPKLDGKRYLMYMTEDRFGFVDRAMNFLYPNEENTRFPHMIKLKQNIKLLLDAEVVEENGILQIFIFDIVLVYTNKLYKIYELPYYSRMDELFKVFNSILRPLNDLFKKENLKIKFYFKDSFDYRILKEPDVSYKSIIKTFNDRVIFSKEETPTYDGIIFINTKFPYFLSPTPAYGQYKWKPVNDLTIDLKLKLINGKWKLLGKYDKIVKLKLGGKKDVDISSALCTKNLKPEYNDRVYEFLYKDKQFVLHENIIDRTGKGANAYLTIKSTIEAAEKHFGISDIKKMFSYITTDTPLTKNILKWADAETAKKLISLCYGKDYPCIPESIEKEFIKFYKYKKIPQIDNSYTEKENLIIKAKIIDLSKILISLYPNVNKKDLKDIVSSVIYNYQIKDAEDFITKINSKLGKKSNEIDTKILNDIFYNITSIKKSIKIFNENITSLYADDKSRKTKFIRISLLKENNSADFYKILSFLKYQMNKPLYEGVKSKEKIDKDKTVVFYKDDNIKIRNIKQVYSEESIFSKKLSYKNPLEYDINVDFFIHTNYPTTVISEIGERGTINYKTTYSIAIPNSNWTIELTKNRNEIQTKMDRREEKKVNMERDKLYAQKSIIESDISHENKKNIIEIQTKINKLNKIKEETEYTWDIAILSKVSEQSPDLVGTMNLLIKHILSIIYLN